MCRGWGISPNGAEFRARGAAKPGDGARPCRNRCRWREPPDAPSLWRASGSGTADYQAPFHDDKSIASYDVSLRPGVASRGVTDRTPDTVQFRVGSPRTCGLPREVPTAAAVPNHPPSDAHPPGALDP